MEPDLLLFFFLVKVELILVKLELHTRRPLYLVTSSDDQSLLLLILH